MKLCSLILVLSTLTMGQAFAQQFMPKAEAGILDVRPCSLNISAEKCGYFVDESHLDLPTPVPARLQAELSKYLNTEVCVYSDDTGKVSLVKPAPCAL